MAGGGGAALAGPAPARARPGARRARAARASSRAGRVVKRDIMARLPLVRDTGVNGARAGGLVSGRTFPGPGAWGRAEDHGRSVSRSKAGAVQPAFILG